MTISARTLLVAASNGPQSLVNFLFLALPASSPSHARCTRPLPIEGLPTGKQCLQVDPQGCLKVMCWAGQGASPARSYVGFTSFSFLPTCLDNRSPAWPSSMPAHMDPTGRFAKLHPPAPPSTHHVPRFSQRRRPSHHPQFLRFLSVARSMACHPVPFCLAAWVECKASNNHCQAP